MEEDKSSSVSSPHASLFNYKEPEQPKPNYRKRRRATSPAAINKKAIPVVKEILEQQERQDRQTKQKSEVKEEADTLSSDLALIFEFCCSNSVKLHCNALHETQLN